MPALRFASSADNTVELRIVLSTGLEEQLTRISEKMVWSQSFEQVRADAARQWADVLSRASVTGGTADERTMFYTSLSIISIILGDLLMAKFDPRISLSSSKGGGR